MPQHPSPHELHQMFNTNDSKIISPPAANTMHLMLLEHTWQVNVKCLLLSDA